MFDFIPSFMVNAYISALLISVVVGIVGTLVVVNRITYIASSISHSSYGGIGLAFFFGLPPFLGALLFVLPVAAFVSYISFHHVRRADAFIGMVWALGMSIGIIAVDLAPSYPGDLMSYLFGNVLLIPRGDLMLIGLLALVVFLIVVAIYRQLVIFSFDKDYALALGIPAQALHFVTIFMIGIASVLLIKMVGLILVIALLTMAPLIMEKYSRSIASMMVYTAVLSLFFMLSGLVLSYYLNLSTSPMIIIVGSVVFFADYMLYRWVWGRS